MGYRRWQGGVGRLECDISTVGGVARTDIGERAGYDIVCIMCTLYIDIASTVFISSAANVYGAGVYHPRNSFISC